MSITLSALQKQRTDTAANWTSANPTLLAGELGFESDTGKAKLGTGSTAWTSLGYLGVIPSSGIYPLSQLLMPSGTVSAPSISFDGDTNLGIYRSGTDQLSFTTAGTERLRIDATGQIEAVSLGTAAAPTFTFTGDPNTGIYSPGADQVAISTNGTGRLYIDASGNVAIAPAISPSFTKSFNISAVNASIALRANSAGTYSDQGIFFAVDAVNYAQIYNSDIGQLIFRTGSGLSERLRITSTGALNFVGAGTAGSTQAVSFNGSAPVNSLVIDSSGRCGVGTSAPGAALDVSSTTGTRIRSSYTNTTGARDAGFEIYADLSGSFAARASFTYFGNLGIASLTSALDLAVSTNSLERLRITSTGALNFVGAGTAGSTQAVSFNGSAPVNSLVIDSSGRLLVGTSTARANFNNSTVSAVLQIEGTTTTNRIASIVSSTASGATGPILIFGKQNSGTVGGNTVVVSGDNLGNIQFQGSDGTEFVEAASITAFVDGTPGANDMPGRIVLSTTLDGAASPTERFRITNDGVIAHDQPEPAAVNATATLTIANLKAGIITSTSALATDMTLPTGTDTQAGFSGTYDNFTFEWSVINTGVSLVRVLAGTAHTVVGSGSVLTGTSGRFASRRTAANTFVTYRLA